MNYVEDFVGLLDLAVVGLNFLTAIEDAVLLSNGDIVVIDVGLAVVFAQPNSASWCMRDSAFIRRMALNCDLVFGGLEG